MSASGDTTTNRTNGTSSAARPKRDATSLLELRADGFLHRALDTGEVRLHVAEARPRGIEANATVPADVPLVVFLHGFPEFYGSWRHQLRALAAGGFWAVAPDMRGYNESDKPAGVRAYEVEHLADDVAGLVRALGRERAIIVGHDWGAVVAWFVAQRHAAMVIRLAILNVPHPLEMLKGLRTLKQLKKSWYMFFFQLPRIPERAITKDDFKQLRDGFAQDGFAAEEIEGYVDAIRVPGALTSALNYYRAAIRRVVMGRVPTTETISCPVLVIWGDRDQHLGAEMATPPALFVPNAKVVHIPEATHWVQNSAPERVNELLLGFVRAEHD